MCYDTAYTPYTAALYPVSQYMTLQEHFSLTITPTYFLLCISDKILRSYAYLRRYNIEVKLNLDQIPNAMKIGEGDTAHTHAHG